MRYFQALPPEAQTEWKNRARDEKLLSHKTRHTKKKPKKSKPATHLNEEEYEKLQRLCMGDDSELDEYADEEVNVLVKEQIDYVNVCLNCFLFKLLLIYLELQGRCSVQTQTHERR
jgi:hypothetical protein